MRTPSLVTRVVVVGVGIVTILTLGVDLLLYVTLRNSLTEGVNDVLRTETRIAREEASRLGAEALPARLAELGIRATVRRPDGAVIPGPALPFDLRQEGDLAFRSSRLPDGTTIEVGAARGDIDRTLSRLLRLELIASPLVIALAFFLLRLIAEVALSPLDQIAAAARRTTRGHKGERLKPDQPDTRLGQVASAYDDMLDALEAAVADARRAEQRYSQILETAREAFVAFDPSGVVTEWNAEAERTFGWSHEEAIGREVAAFLLPPDEREGPFAKPEWFLSHADDPPSDHVVSLNAVHREGHVFPAGATVWVTSHDGTNTINAFMWDMTDRLQAQEARARLATIVESSDEAILSTDLKGTILTWNQGAERMYGYTADEAVGQDLSIIVPPDWQSEVGNVLESIRAGEGVQRVDAVRCRKNGTRLDVSLTISPITDQSGEICGTSSVARDVTAERKMAAQLDATLGALERALYEAQASEQATRQFLDDAAHQLRAPITSLRASAETLLRGADPDERDRLLGAVVRETSRASRLMSGLLHMARLNQGRKISFERCDLLALCQEEVDRAHWVAPQLDLVVAQEGATPPGDAQVDPEAVGEILANLLDNARRHARTCIEVGVGRENGQFEVKVTNDGPRIPPDKAEAIFDRFVSLDGRGGSGLGLPIARELARAQGGELTYEENAFVLRLPATR